MCFRDGSSTACSEDCCCQGYLNLIINCVHTWKEHPWPWQQVPQLHQEWIIAISSAWGYVYSICGNGYGCRKWQPKAGRQSQECYFSLSRSALLTNLFLGTIQNAGYLLKDLGQDLIKIVSYSSLMNPQRWWRGSSLWSLRCWMLRQWETFFFVGFCPVQGAIWNSF